MKLTEFEIVDQGGPEMLKAWLIAMNTDAKAGKATFEINGGYNLPARGRTGAAKVSGATMWLFSGGEKLSIQSIYEDKDVARNSTTLKVTFVPASTSLKLLQEGFASMTMELDRAFPLFDGLEAWAGEKSAIAPSLLKKKEIQHFATPVKEEAHRESAEWGAW